MADTCWIRSDRTFFLSLVGNLNQRSEVLVEIEYVTLLDGDSATNSAKFAYYTPGLLGRNITFGSLKDCVIFAVEGKIVRDETLWKH